jgi:hypothetical protein
MRRRLKSIGPCTNITSRRILFPPNEIGNGGRIPKYSLGHLSKYNSSCKADRRLGEPKSYQVEDDKILVEDPSSTVQW